mmetsp:Transcript_17489/g.41067  ORF Transcript_17489/g.41067 Transcript_17489/m.41067 type:complete len:490 (-) Transcript_17489:68-1537(-)
MAELADAGDNQLNDALGGMSDKKPPYHAFRTFLEQLQAEFLADIEKRKDHLAASLKFNLLMSFLIVVNAVITGIEVDQYRGDLLEDRTLFAISDGVFLLIFAGEMILRMNHLGWGYFVDPWNGLDYILVILNVSDFVIMINNQGAAGPKLASTLRALRLLRVVRVIRGLRFFHGLWIIIHSILESFRAVVWVTFLVALVMYSVAVSISTAVTETEDVHEQWQDSEQYFGNPWKSLWTLTQVVTLDRWASDVARPLLKVSPLSVALLIVAIVVCTFGTANLVIAVMVEHLQEIMEATTTKSNRVVEVTETNIMKAMGEEFQLADLDGNGELGLKEFREILATPKIVLQLHLLGMECDEAEMLFEVMDADKSGAVSPEEFVMGLTKLKGQAKGQDLVAFICCCQLQCQRADKFVERIKKLNEQADMIQERLDDIGKGLTTELVSRQNAAQRHEEVWKRAGDRSDVIGALDRSRQIAFPTLNGGNARYGILY